MGIGRVQKMQKPSNSTICIKEMDVECSTAITSMQSEKKVYKEACGVSKWDGQSSAKMYEF